ncbi:MAG: CaiB/BaiF CoA-transferase family protein [Burkholderiaceae bacterium]
MPTDDTDPADVAPSPARERRGPLTDLTIVEFAGLGPAPFAAMMLADMGARVIRIDRPVKPLPAGAQLSGIARMAAREVDVLARGRESIALDLKQPGAVDLVLRLIERADALIEGFRPGVMESLGLGPDICLARRPSLVYGRATGWGQTGPLAQAAGHDINYTALSGALHAIGRAGDAPIPVPGMIGDFGGGGMLLAFGLMAGIHSARISGVGQVVDAAVCDGAALLNALHQGWHSAGLWQNARGTNMGDGGAHFYDVYRCADGRYISLGAIEPQFYRRLRELCGLEDPVFDAQWNPAAWSELKQRVAEVIAGKSRDQWCELLESTDACFAPVLDFVDAPTHPHNVARSVFATVDGVTQPTPAPKFSATPAGACAPIGEVGAQTEALLAELGLSAHEMSSWVARA